MYDISEDSAASVHRGEESASCVKANIGIGTGCIRAACWAYANCP